MTDFLDLFCLEVVSPFKQQLPEVSQLLKAPPTNDVTRRFIPEFSLSGTKPPVGTPDFVTSRTSQPHLLKKKEHLIKDYFQMLKT